MKEKIFTFHSYKGLAGKIVGVLVMINFFVLLYLLLAETSPLIPKLYNFDVINVIMTFIILFIANASLNRRRYTLNILEGGQLDVFQWDKKKSTDIYNSEIFPKYHLLLEPGVFQDTIHVILLSKDGRFQTLVALGIPKDDFGAVNSLSTALGSFGYKEIPSNDKKLIEYVKFHFGPSTMRRGKLM